MSMKLIFCLFLLTLFSLGLCKSKKKKKDTLSRFGLTEEEKENLVDAHNEYRRKANSTGMNMLTWDDDLATDAMTWAKGCVWGHGQPSNPAFTSGRPGQNLGYTTKWGALKNDSFVEWVEEEPFYNFTTNVCEWPPCGHYKQVMWQKSRMVGCAFYVCPEMKSNSGALLDRDAEHLVCNYWPPGNVYSARPWSVGTPCRDCLYCKNKLCVTRETCMKHRDKCVCGKKCKHCGTVNDKCECDCPPGTYGEECEYICRDKKVECYYYGKRSCNDGSAVGKVVNDYCLRTCERCQPNTNTSWTCGEETHENTFVRYGSTPQYSYRTLSGKKCVFPFRYNGKYYDHCLPEAGTTWCSLSADFDTYRTYSYDCRTIKTEGGNSNGTDCVFPFKFKGQYYQRCMHDREHDKYWCGTTADFDKDKKYGYCQIPEGAK